MIDLSYLFIFLFLFTGTRAFYLPGVAPTDYSPEQNVPLLVNHLTPSRHGDKTYLYALDYYYDKFQFCKPQKIVKQTESLGSALFGDRIFNSPFEIRMLKNESCKSLCNSKYSKADARFINRNIRRGYTHNWVIDGLPAATSFKDERTNSIFYGPGFGLGDIDNKGTTHINNHYDIIVEYHVTPKGKNRVVGVLIEPSSRLQSIGEDGNLQCNPNADAITLSMDDEDDPNNNVLFSYSVSFVPSKTAWATRWDKYLHVYDPKIQWISLINFTIIIIFLAGIMVNILIRALRRDLVRYNEVDLDEEVQDDGGWKLVHGDVFRAPQHSLLLSVFIGSGFQLLLMCIVAIIFALLGLLSPSNRGSLGTAIVLLYAFFGIAGGFLSAYVYKFFGGDKWKLNALLTPLLVPSIMFFVFLSLNFFLIFAKSSGAVPIGTMFAVVFIWFLISIPLSLIGSFIGWKKQLPENPVRTNQIPRQIPVQPFYLKFIPTTLVAGIFPFGAMVVELYFIFNSIWFQKIYYMFGFLFICFILMILATAIVTVLMSYYILCAENYHWQWRSFLIAGGCALYVFIDSLCLVGFSVSGFTSIVLLFGYSLMISFAVFILCGTIGFISTWVFVRKIYGALKVD